MLKKLEVSCGSPARVWPTAGRTYSHRGGRRRPRFILGPSQLLHPLPMRALVGFVREQLVDEVDHEHRTFVASASNAAPTFSMWRRQTARPAIPTTGFALQVATAQRRGSLARISWQRWLFGLVLIVIIMVIFCWAMMWVFYPDLYLIAPLVVELVHPWVKTAEKRAPPGGFRRV